MARAVEWVFRAAGCANDAPSSDGETVAQVTADGFSLTHGDRQIVGPAGVAPTGASVKVSDEDPSRVKDASPTAATDSMSELPAPVRVAIDDGQRLVSEVPRLSAVWLAIVDLDKVGQAVLLMLRSWELRLRPHVRLCCPGPPPSAREPGRPTQAASTASTTSGSTSPSTRARCPRRNVRRPCRDLGKCPRTGDPRGQGQCQNRRQRVADPAQSARAGDRAGHLPWAPPDLRKTPSSGGRRRQTSGR